MRLWGVMAAIASGMVSVAFTARTPGKDAAFAGHTLAYVKEHARAFGRSTVVLDSAVKAVRDGDTVSLAYAKQALRQSRASYKRIEFFLTYFFRSNSVVYNEPPNYEVEEPFYEYKSPTGLQVVEAILFSPDPLRQRKELLQQASLLEASAGDIYAFLYNLDITDAQILESVRLGLVRVMTLGITGYDAPELKTGVSESADALDAFNAVLSPLLAEGSPQADSVSVYLDRAIKKTRNHPDFDSFDRLDFLTGALFPLCRHLDALIRSRGLELNTSGVLNYRAHNLFSADALYIDPKSNPYNLPIFPADTARITRAENAVPDTALITLGRRLFYEKALSGTGTRSCASCHEPRKYFTDQLARAQTLDGRSVVQRNTPTLLYVSYQYSQFWDGRARSLESQIRTVLANPLEMDADTAAVVGRLKSARAYVSAFEHAFPGVPKDSAITVAHLGRAVAAFLKTLAPFDSPFDHYMQGDRTALTTAQKRGFNLFMGKGLCATCHFVPLFNGLLPPFYDMTELENLGVTRDTAFTDPVLDADSGRFLSTPATYYMRAFKTPTLRNVAETFPYMHNGAFPDLRSVVDFYDKGGAQGMGLDNATQTLSPEPLHLTDEQTGDIIAFLQSLTDAPAAVAATAEAAPRAAAGD
jgi:cytochrome c peroxidase